MRFPRKQCLFAVRLMRRSLEFEIFRRQHLFIILHGKHGVIFAAVWLLFLLFFGDYVSHRLIFRKLLAWKRIQELLFLEIGFNLLNGLPVSDLWQRRIKWLRLFFQRKRLIGRFIDPKRIVRFISLFVPTLNQCQSSLLVRALDFQLSCDFGGLSDFFPKVLVELGLIWCLVAILSLLVDPFDRLLEGFSTL